MSNPEAPNPAPAVEVASVAQYKTALRTAIRRNQEMEEVSHLNITAMLDIMTIILVFLLKTLGESAGAIPQSDDLMIPKSILQTEPAQEGVKVTISKSQIMVGNESVLMLPSRESLVNGVGARHKNGNPNTLLIVPLGNALRSARQMDKAILTAKGMDASSSEAMIICDNTVPYRLFMEVLYTLGQNEFATYHLMVMQSEAD